MPMTIDQIVRLYRSAGAARYGMEAITQEQHALQCGLLAQRADAPDTLVAAALLHDLGHLLAHTLPESAAGKDDLHEYRAIPFLRGEFGDAVIEPMRLHVAAKRWLCAADPAYHDGLSPASRHSLALQGGAFTTPQAADFLAQPHAAEAVQLRRWDDQAKSPTRETPGWEHFRPVLERARHCLPSESVRPEPVHL
ncbi:phosphonate degradation HD-domain oxygenase [Ramlibacter sp.]|uniref:phosphonate degradation HD-domain oxygenase n=1 Tax=Ramlibacter sp. TaxID=1917967 RepID=UPI0017A35D87|nr:phosphonate degradation HD-domain oxygenase [Ramlibacter sp.]MBA2673906.1 phosphohydrolase [Ramlibacter sp.]